MINNPILEFEAITSTQFIQRFITVGIGVAFIFGVVAFFFMLLIGAIAVITSGGDKANVETAKARMRNAVIGLVILFSIFAMVKVVETLFGVSVLNIDLSQIFITTQGGTPPPIPPCTPPPPCPE